MANVLPKKRSTSIQQLGKYLLIWTKNYSIGDAPRKNEVRVVRIGDAKKFQLFPECYSSLFWYSSRNQIPKTYHRDLITYCTMYLWYKMLIGTLLTGPSQKFYALISFFIKLGNFSLWRSNLCYRFVFFKHVFNGGFSSLETLFRTRDTFSFFEQSIPLIQDEMMTK